MVKNFALCMKNIILKKYPQTSPDWKRFKTPNVSEICMEKPEYCPVNKSFREMKVSGAFQPTVQCSQQGYSQILWDLESYISHLEKFPLPTPNFFFFFEGKDFSGAEGNSNFAWICLESLDFFNTFLFVFAVFVNWHSKRQCADLGLEGLGSFFFHQKGQKNGCRF